MNENTYVKETAGKSWNSLDPGEGGEILARLLADEAEGSTSSLMVGSS